MKGEINGTDGETCARCGSGVSTGPYEVVTGEIEREGLIEGGVQITEPAGEDFSLCANCSRDFRGWLDEKGPSYIPKALADMIPAMASSPSTGAKRMAATLKYAEKVERPLTPDEVDAIAERFGSDEDEEEPTDVDGEPFAPDDMEGLIDGDGENLRADREEVAKGFFDEMREVMEESGGIPDELINDEDDENDPEGFAGGVGMDVPEPDDGDGSADDSAPRAGAHDTDDETDAAKRDEAPGNQSSIELSFIDQSDDDGDSDKNDAQTDADSDDKPNPEAIPSDGSEQNEGDANGEDEANDSDLHPAIERLPSEPLDKTHFTRKPNMSLADELPADTKLFKFLEWLARQRYGKHFTATDVADRTPLTDRLATYRMWSGGSAYRKGLMTRRDAPDDADERWAGAISVEGRVRVNEAIESMSEDERNSFVPLELSDEHGGEDEAPDGVLNELTAVPRISAHKAHMLYDAGIRSVDDLRDATQEELADIKGLNPALAAAVKSEVGESKEEPTDVAGDFYDGSEA
jgi:hypothetical protein